MYNVETSMRTSTNNVKWLGIISTQMLRYLKNLQMHMKSFKRGPKKSREEQLSHHNISGINQWLKSKSKKSMKINASFANE